jgi:hypothetical protein
MTRVMTRATTIMAGLAFVTARTRYVSARGFWMRSGHNMRAFAWLQQRHEPFGTIPPGMLSHAHPRNRLGRN